MNLSAIIYIAIGLSMDAFAVSLTNGMMVKKLRIPYALKLSVFFGVFQMLMPIVGWLAGVGFSGKVSAVGNYIAFVVLAVIGGKMIMDSHKQCKCDEIQGKSEESSLKIIVCLAIATSIDALAVGVTFACTGVTLFSTLVMYCAIIGAITLVICLAGVYMGRRFGGILANKAGYLGGAILLIIAVKMLIQ
ncbi:MAG: manganese efflux pump MntP family protein [Acutalibacteraceae bacterium]|jgi:putative Mn2+ efflux pump MntP|nr:manganese efflux pump [Clostridiales bacterium]